jgi:hypothetical protein
MTETIDAIEDRVSPQRIVTRRQEAVKSQVRGWKERVMGSPDDDLSYGGARYAGQPGGTYGTYGAYDEDDGGPSVGERLSETAGTAGERVREAPQAVRQQAQGNPLAAGLIAFGAGLVMASLIPESRTERQAAARVQPALGQVAAEAKSAGQEVASVAAETAKSEAEGLKETAAEAAQQVKGEATSSAQDVKEHAADAGQQVKEQARPGS